MLAEEGADLPWHRILRSDGAPTPRLVREQLSRLRAGGVVSVRQKVDLREYRRYPETGDA
ncbi:hypothetical protein [Actinophytocola oryzae]|uniref:6-O-methylguanine DNA methyltransferase-like protein n=1 Tax=Actinophytocola oryzae TaxID=502181 RepID=A0A4R7VQD3_9PSEU|nr:hypothetical protein CLV71_1053 [Actinophytocola oryzae]